MHLLLLLNAPHYLRPFAETVRTLADRGHRVTIAWYADGARGDDGAVERFADRPSVSFTTVPQGRSVHDTEVGLVRRARNYLRYLEQPFRGSWKLRRRSFSKLLKLVTRSVEVDASWSEAGLALRPAEVRRLTQTLEYIEWLIPTDPACTAFLIEHGFDAVLVSPLVDLGSSGQVDVVKAAQALGIPVGMLVYSWDNLSTKGDMHVIPDRVFLWNRRQWKEAVRLHGVQAERVVMTGAPRFDEFLSCASTVPREQFLASMGLDPAMPVVMYVCSSAFVSGDELSFVRLWLAALRGAASPTLQGCNVIVRPHPDLPLLGPEFPGTKADILFDGVPVSVRRPFNDDRAIVVSISGRTPQGLFECLFHSDAVVGLNTSAEIEAALLGKPVFSVLAGRAADGQESTMHFFYLLKSEGGFVELADSFASHAEQIAAFLDAPLAARRVVVRAARRRALKFVRPLGTLLPVSALLADAIERELSGGDVRGRPVLVDGGADVDA